MKYIYPIIIAFVSSISHAAAPVFSIVDYGTYQETKDISHRNLEPSEVSVLSEAIIIKSKHIEQTKIITGQKDVLFGFRYKINGKDVGKLIEVKHRYIHPPLPSSEGKLITEDILFHKRKVGEIYNHQWYFDNLTSKHSGNWLFELYFNNVVVLKVKFVVKPHANKSLKQTG